MWSAQEVQNYCKWLESERGQFILSQEKKLLAHLISTWPRKKQSLIDLGCGPGSFLNFFSQTGFEVMGVDKNPYMLKAARKTTKDKIPLALADLSSLPFSENEFDFGAILLVLEFVDQPEIILEEAKRIVKKGLLIAFLNKYSFYYWQKKVFAPANSPLAKAKWFSWPQMKKIILHNVSPYSYYARSVLPGPTVIWQNKIWTKPIHSLFYPPWLGSFIGVRADILKTANLTNPVLVYEPKPLAQQNVYCPTSRSKLQGPEAN